MSLERIRLSGCARERGRAFGKERAVQIRSWLDSWLYSLRVGGINDAQSYLAAFLQNTRFRPCVAQWTPDLLVELECMAEAAQVPADLLFAAQLLDEEWAFRKRELGGPARQKCSAAALPMGAGAMLIGQNMDLDRFTDGHQLLIETEQDASAPPALIFTVGGLVGLMGVNAAPLALCVNALPDLPTRSSGLPVAFVIRKLLQSQTLDQAETLLRQIPHATSQHYLIASPLEARAFEVTPLELREVQSSDHRIFHTNHPLAFSAEPLSEGARENSRVRLETLERRLSAQPPGIDLFEDALSSSDDSRHPVCKNGRADWAGPGDIIGFTTGSMIAALVAGYPLVRCRFSAGPPALHGYEEATLPATALAPRS